MLASAQTTLTLELRVFDGSEEVTTQTRLKLHRGGERADVVAQTNPGQSRVELTVGEGIYDAQAIRQKGDEVVSIRWANRLVVMPYPDEGGHHLEVVNFKSGFGALQIRSRDGVRPDVALYQAGSRTKEVAIELHPGDCLEIRSSGGGGWGPQAKRSADARKRDEEQGLTADLSAELKA